ncbi:MAG: hypothetical protein O6926_02385 [candidate division NC10 bacterium]|nr:hypothetical protein [candidate division NC10 bacterium]
MSTPFFDSGAAPDRQRIPHGASALQNKVGYAIYATVFKRVEMDPIV